MQGKIWPVMLLAMLGANFTGCSGSGGNDDNSTGGATHYRGKTGAATVDESNREALGVAAIDAVDAARGLPDTDAQAGGSKTAQAIVDNTAVGDCGGSLRTSAQTSASGNTTTLIYDNYCEASEGSQKITDGTVKVAVEYTLNPVSVRSNVVYDQLSVTRNGKTKVVNGSTVVDTAAGTYSNDWVVTVDGTAYRLQDYQVTGSSSGGYTVHDGTVFHPDYGSIVVDADNPLVFTGCDNGNPASGRLRYQGAAGSSGSIEFLNCRQYQVCAGDGSICDTYDW